MAATNEAITVDGAGNPALEMSHQEVIPEDIAAPEPPTGSDDAATNGPAIEALKEEKGLPATPPKPPAPAKRTKHATPRIRKKLPWKGKTITVLLPRDEERGQVDGRPWPLNKSAVADSIRSWEEQGYNTQGFDLQGSAAPEHSQSRGAWPDFDELERERTEQSYKVTLPDLNAWKNYVEELQEAKLRALGVSFGDDPAPPPSISPAPGTAMSRRASITHYPSSLPFSPPIPTSSAASNHAMSGFPFPQFAGSSGVSSPGIPGVPSPFAPGKFAHNPRASISVSSPHSLAWSPQMLMQHGIARGGSPALAHFGALGSPTSPFSPDGLHGSMHQRHMSLQYPVLSQQFQHSARASPRLHELHELQEEEEEEPSKSPSKTPEPTQALRPNSSDSLQKEIDEAEYHLEEQMRSQLDNDQDYSPHNDQTVGGEPGQMEDVAAGHSRDQSAQFAPQAPRFVNNSEGTVLHHPRPHSRGHSLSTKYFNEDDVANTAGSFKPTALPIPENHNAEDSEIETNPSIAGTPVQGQAFDFPKMLSHDRSFSTTSNPWTENEPPRPSSNFGGQQQPSHSSKSSYSKLNVAAPEFKFNPANNFQPGAGMFSFAGAAAVQPTVFQSSVNVPPSATSSHFSFPAVTSPTMINANAPVFSPGQSEFNFSSSGPMFRPNAPAFVPPISVAGSIHSPVSGAESLATGSIFGSIDLSSPDIKKPAKKSKAVPIVRPQSRDSRSSRAGVREAEDSQDEQEEVQHMDKRVRGSSKDADEVPLFAPLPDEEATPVPEDMPKAVEPEIEAPNDKAEADLPAEEKSFDENLMQTDTTFSSARVSETTGTDSKTTVSPSETSPDPGPVKWQPFEFRNTADVQSFNDARPFGDDDFEQGHAASLSASAKAFDPAATLWDPLAQPNDANDSGEEDVHEAVEDTSELPLESVDTAVEEQVEDTIQVVMPVKGEPLEEPAEIAVDVRKGLAASRFASSPPPAKGLAASRFASIASIASPPAVGSPDLGESTAPATPAPEEEGDEQPSVLSPGEDEDDTQSLPDADELAAREQFAAEEASMADIDAIMAHLNANPYMGVNKAAEPAQWQQASPTRRHVLGRVSDSSPVRLPPQNLFRSDAPSPSPKRYKGLPDFERTPTPPGLEDPFLDPPQIDEPLHSLIHRLSGSVSLASDWDGVFTEDEHAKFEARISFFDGRVNGLVGDLLSNRLGPVEESLDDIKNALSTIAHGPRSFRRERRSMSGELQESDADDEDDDLPSWAPRNTSPKRDRKMEHIRAAVLDAFAQQQRAAPREVTPPAEHTDASADMNAAVVKALEEMKEQLSQSAQLDFHGDDIRNIVEEAVQARMPPTPQPDLLDAANEKNKELQARLEELESRLRSEGDRADKEILARRAAEEGTADLRRRLESAETRVEIEIMNKSVFVQRFTDLEDKLHHQEAKTNDQQHGRRIAEDRLAEIQRVHRITVEEEKRLHELVEEKAQHIKSLEASHHKALMRLTLLENAHSNSQQSQSEFQNRLNANEVELRDTRQEARHWKVESERLMEASARHEADLKDALGENRAMRKLLDTLGTQLQENEKMRDSWRTRFLSLQDDMAEAAREIEEDNSQRIKTEQTLLARQEVLEARLQAEAKTRERIEAEVQRLEDNELKGLRAMSELKRLEPLLGELRTENHNLQQTARRFQAEFEEARESGAREVQRTRDSMEAELEQANHQVNVVREELEDQVASLRAQLDRVKLDADTAQARHDMLLEEAQHLTKTGVEELLIKHQAELQEVNTKHQNEVDDMQARYERQLNNTTEDAQRAEQNLLERLSISASKSEYLQDKVAHLEEKLEIATQAAKAAAQAARSSITNPEPNAAATAQDVSRSLDLPEKISPQALRESIMVLQEQLHERELRIEDLEQQVAKVDPEVETKIAKRDDEITWLRELLGVRHSDLQDIILALQRDDYDRSAVKDAAVRLKANLQMEEQERERAMNGGSAINLPNIAATIRDAATPRVAQAVGPLAAALGNWRRSRNPGSFGSLSGAMSSPGQGSHHNSTPSKAGPSAQNNSFLGGLLTPPASGVRQTPPSSVPSQPTAFSSTGRRFTSGSQQAAGPSRARGPSLTAKQAEKQPLGATPPRRAMPTALSEPVTPPMMRLSAYDADAHAEEFDDAGFFEDE